MNKTMTRFTAEPALSWEFVGRRVFFLLLKDPQFNEQTWCLFFFWSFTQYLKESSWQSDKALFPAQQLSWLSQKWQWPAERPLSQTACPWVDVTLCWEICYSNEIEPRIWSVGNPANRIHPRLAFFAGKIGSIKGSCNHCIHMHNI